jgi:hypothetical protein
MNVCLCRLFLLLLVRWSIWNVIDKNETSGNQAGPNVVVNVGVRMVEENLMWLLMVPNELKKTGWVLRLEGRVQATGPRLGIVGAMWTRIR